MREAKVARQSAPHVYYSTTKSLCVVCRQAVDAKVVFRDGRVYFEKFCPDHGSQTCLVAGSVEWYLDCLRFLAPNTPPRRTATAVSERGCPFDCGSCPAHVQKFYLPVVPITSACNLDCPICYTLNRNRDAYHASPEDMRHILEHLVHDHDEVDIINFTGGEPTLNEHLPAFLRMCREAGIRRLTVSTNGLRLLDEAYVEELAAEDANIVLSLDSFRPETDKAMLGANTVAAKMRVLELLEKHGVGTTLLPAVARGINDDELGAIFDLMIRRPNIRSLEVQTLAFTGQSGTAFPREARITIPDIHDLLDQATEGRIRTTDFVPSPLAHPHCYSICYLLMLDDSRYVPFTRFMPRAKLFELLQDSLYIEPREELEQVFQGVIDELWADPDRLPESEAVLSTLKRLLQEVFPTDRRLDILERQRISERIVKTIYIHAHMDAENFDVARVMKCCTGVTEPDGRNLPTCSYNILYRERDPRFVDPAGVERLNLSRAGKA